MTILAVDDCASARPRAGRRGDAPRRDATCRRRPRPPSSSARRAACARGRRDVASSGPTDATEADWLRQARRLALRALERQGTVRMEDVGVPRGRVPELLVAIEADRPTAHGVRVATFGHAGDGNLHPNFIFERDDPRAAELTEAVRDEIFAAALALGGTVTAEHGDRAVAARVRSSTRSAPDAVDVMRSIKAALDPLGILNPGPRLHGRSRTRSPARSYWPRLGPVWMARPNPDQPAGSVASVARARVAWSGSKPGFSASAAAGACVASVVRPRRVRRSSRRGSRGARRGCRARAPSPSPLRRRPRGRSRGAPRRRVPAVDVLRTASSASARLSASVRSSAWFTSNRTS